MTTGRITAAASPITFIDADGNQIQYRFSPLNDKDMDELDEWIQSKVVETAARAIKPDMSQAVQEMIMKSAHREALVVTWLSEAGAKILGTVHGMTHLCWKSLRKEHPNITEDDIRPLLLLKGNLQKVNEKFGHVNAVPGYKSKNAKRAKARRAR